MTAMVAPTGGGDGDPASAMTDARVLPVDSAIRAGAPGAALKATHVRVTDPVCVSSPASAISGVVRPLGAVARANAAAIGDGAARAVAAAPDAATRTDVCAASTMHSSFAVACAAATVTTRALGAAARSTTHAGRAAPTVPVSPPRSPLWQSLPAR